MKIDIEKAAELGAIGKIKVTLDGFEVYYCIEADDEECYIIQLVPDSEGSFLMDENGELITRRVKGQVEIIIED